jgi:hypothetical protein
MSTDLRQAVARAICKTGRFETGEGACAVLCMDALGCARQGCGHVERIHGKMADAVLAALSASIGEDVVEAAKTAVLDEFLRGGYGLTTACNPDWIKIVINTAAPILALAARDATLEEAALVADKYEKDVATDDAAETAVDIADDIRAMKSGGQHG